MVHSDPRHHISDCIDLLSDAPLELSYLAEGNANIIYTVKPLDSSLASHNNCCVLRLRKDLPFTKSAIEVLSAFNIRIAPLYIGRENLLLQQALYKLDERTLDQAQFIVRTLERDGKPSRPEKRMNVYLPTIDEEQHGILMPNLKRFQGTRFLEFKPKWLVQSPSAPKDAVRCRTCALNAVRREQGKSPGRGDSGFCPMKLISKDETILKEILHNLDPLTASESFIHDFISKVQPALMLHQRLQQEHNQVGLDDFLHPADKDFSISMALRDASLFLVVETTNPSQPRIIDVKFADLDLKTADGGKLSHWASIEQSLLSSASYLTPDNICALSP